MLSRVPKNPAIFKISFPYFQPGVGDAIPLENDVKSYSSISRRTAVKEPFADTFESGLEL